MNLKDLKKDCAQKQKKGIHFIIASVVIWIMVINKKSIDILLHCTIITYSFFNF